MDIKLKKYGDEKDEMLSFITSFWKEHNNTVSTVEETFQDLFEWTSIGHALYLIEYKNEFVGFVHLGGRGNGVNWLEDIFVLPEFQNQGIGTAAIQMIEEIVKEYSDSLYIEVAARNEKALRLYRKIGYDCLNTITIRKDFQPNQLETIQNETLYDLDFEVRQKKVEKWNANARNAAIRKMLDSDINEVMQIWLETNIQTHDFINFSYWKNHIDYVKEAMSQAEVYVYVDENTQVINGFIGVNDDYIEGVFVRRKMQSKGIGKQLLDYIKTLKNSLRLHVYLKNTRAIQFYQKEGFRIVGESLDEENQEKEFLMEYRRDNHGNN